ncbi:MAG: glycine--tRNA ligase [Nanoarchaeota archaeon]
MPESKSDKIMNIATKRGFFFPSGEIYNSKAGFWTYGHLGTLLKHKFEDLWRDYFLSLNENYYEIEDTNILAKEVFKSSGHLEHFSDPLTECKKCHFRFRADELIEDETSLNVQGLKENELDKIIKENKLKCPKCGSELDKVKFFNMMFDLKVGATGEDIMYLRPETAQSPFLAFKREFMALRERLPLGLAVIGKAFRNEISPRQGFFRLREFTQAELQIFFDSEGLDKCENWNEVKNYKLKLFMKNKLNEISCEDTNKKLKLPRFYVYHLAKIQKFYLDVLKIPKEKFRFRELNEKERAFYNKIHFDIELNLETLKGFKEVGGVHYRSDYDLSKHQEGSGAKLEVGITKDGKTKKLLAHVLELSFGVDRNLWGLLDLFYDEDKERAMFKLPFDLVPVEVAVFPLLDKDKLPEKALEVYNLLKENYKVFFDNKGSIGKMYRRVDEIGVPAMITVDHQTLKDNSVTLRNRNDMKQIRVKIKDLNNIVKEFLNGKDLNKLGKIIN